MNPWNLGDNWVGACLYLWVLIMGLLGYYIFNYILT